MNEKKIKVLAAQIRLETLKVIHSRGFGHVGGSMDLADLMAVLYGEVMKYDPKNPRLEDRDWLVLSKGHAGPVAYATFGLMGFYPMEEAYTLNQPGTKFPSHTDRKLTPGVDLTTGSTSTLTTLIVPLSSAMATPKDAENSTRPTASSIATTISSSRVMGPSALYCRTTINVAAGAVAAAMAPSVMAEETEIASGRMKCSRISAASTISVAQTACRMPTMIACRPMVLSWLTRNSLPMVNAIKPKATCERMFRRSTDSIEEKPRPGIPSRPMKKGPSSRPATR